MAKISDISFDSALVIMIFLVLLAIVIPSIFVHTQGEELRTIEQSEGDTDTLKKPLEASAVFVTNDTINVTVYDTDTGNSTKTGAISLSNSQTITIENEDVTVTFVESLGSDTALIKYEYPVFYQWNDVTTGFISIIALLILALFLAGIIVLFEGEK